VSNPLNMFTVSFANGIDNAPTITEDLLRKFDWIYYDSDNLFPQRMVTLADNSPIHGAAIAKHAMFIGGDGLEFEDEATEEQALQYLEKVFGGKTALNLAIKGLAQDRAYFNGHTVALQYTRGRELLSAKHYDFTTIRVSRELDNGTPRYVYYSPDWEISTGRKSYGGKYVDYEPQKFKNFSAWQGRNGVMFIYDKQYKPSKRYYPEPEYIGGLKYVETECNLGQYVNRLVIKGFKGGTHIHLFKEFDDDQAKKVESAMNEKFTNEESPDIVLTYGGDPTSAPTINNIPNLTNSEILTTVGAELDKKIDLAHPIPSMLYTSFQTATGLDGQANAIKEVLEYYQNTAVRPQQEAIENTLNTILEMGGIQNTCRIKAANPITFIADKDIMLEVLKVNEIRQEMNWPRLEDNDPRGEVIPAEVKQQSNNTDVQRQDNPDNAN